MSLWWWLGLWVALSVFTATVWAVSRWDNRIDDD